jgi:hypothetical protein
VVFSVARQPLLLDRKKRELGDRKHNFNAFLGTLNTPVRENALRRPGWSK